jgi:hypothetical protein
MITKEVLDEARKLWDYHHLYHEPAPSDCILVLGSLDLRVADRGAELYLEGLAPILIFSGGLGKVTENILFTQQLLEDKGLHPHTFLLVQKPYMERRSYATFKKRWPDKELIVTSPQIAFEDYPTPEMPMERVIDMMVGDLQRIRLYPEKGFQIPQEIPGEVWAAYEKLVDWGFIGHLAS